MVATVVGFPGGTTCLFPAADLSTGTAPEQALTTTVQDPEHPGEPWVVSTYRRPDESEPAFLKRHMDMVAAVRSALGR